MHDAAVVVEAHQAVLLRGHSDRGHVGDSAGDLDRPPQRRPSVLRVDLGAGRMVGDPDAPVSASRITTV